MSANTFSVYDLIKRDALLFPDSKAVVDGESSITFLEFFTHVNSLASGIYASGVKPYQRVAILSMNRVEYLALYGAAAATGAILVPLNWRLSTEEIAYILKDSDSKLLFFDSTQEAQAYALKGSSGFSGDLVSFDEHSSVNGQHHIEVSSLSYKRMVESGAQSSFAFTPFLAQPDDLFSLIYTAAVSGKPRGAALSHSNIMASNIQTCLTMNLGKSDVYLNMLPLFHITGMNLSLAAMHMGGTNVIMAKFNAQEALAKIERDHVTLMASFPPILTTLMDEMDKGKVTGDNKGNGSQSAVHDISSLKNTVGIDSPETILKFREKSSSSFWILYGQSETSGFVTLSDASETPGSAGRQGSISNMAIVDQDDVILPSGESGEIVARGPLVFQGFWRGGSYETSTSERYDRSSIRNGWHHTGDIGHIDSDGYLWFEGRKPEKELIKPGGENVYPAEVEAVVMAHPDIEECCVIGVPDPKFGEGVKAVCVRKAGSDLTERGVIDFVGERIARYKKPGYVEFVEALPKRGDGSVDRKEVKALYGG